jgi:hypothetical protein
MIYKMLIHDAIRSVITPEYIQKEFSRSPELYNSVMDRDVINRTMLQLIDDITRNIAEERRLSVTNMVHNTSQSGNYPLNYVRRIVLRVIANLKQSEYYKHCKILTDESNNWKVSVDIDIDYYNTKINIGKYVMYGHDIMKHQYGIYNSNFSIKYRMMSESLYTKIMNIIERCDVDQSNEDVRFDSQADVRRLNSATRILQNTNFHIDTTRNFTINSKGQMTYTPKGKITKIVDSDGNGDVWKSDTRQEMKYGKAIRQIYNRAYLPPVSDKFIEMLSQKLKALYIFDAKLEVVEGEDIRKYYNYRQYNSDVSTESLGNSCMRHSSCEDYFDIYVDNPDKVKMLIGKTDNGIIGRALLWTTDDDDKIMDRIYGSTVTINAFKNWAHSNGYMHKRVQSYSNDTEFVSPIGEAIDKCYEITLANNNDAYPYMDTFKYCDDLDASTICLTNDTNNDNYVLDSTDGGPGNLTTCVNGERYHEDDVYYIETGSVEEGYYHNDDTSWCDWTNDTFHTDDMIRTRCGQWVYRENNDLVYIESEDCYVHSDDGIYSDHYGEYIIIDNAIECPVVGYIWSADSKNIEIDDVDYNVHENVTEEELITLINNTN